MKVISGRDKLSTWSVNASTKAFKIIAVPEIAANFIFKNKKPNRQSNSKNTDCPKMLAKVPSTDFVDSLNKVELKLDFIINNGKV